MIFNLSFDIFDGYVVLRKIDNVAEVKEKLSNESGDTE